MFVYHDNSAVLLLDLRRRLKAVVDVLRARIRDGLLWLGLLSWLREDPLFILTSGSGRTWFLLLLFCFVTLSSLLVVLGFWPIWAGLVGNSEKLGFPTFAVLGKGRPTLRDSLVKLKGWLPFLPEVALPRLTGEMLAEVVRRKGAAAGSLDGWGWREFKALTVSWFDGLLLVFSLR